MGLSGITFRRGGAERDLSGWRTADVDQRIELVREAAGDRYERLELNALVQAVVVTDDRRQAAEELARRWPQLSPMEILESPYVLIGTVELPGHRVDRRPEVEGHARTSTMASTSATRMGPCAWSTAGQSALG